MQTSEQRRPAVVPPDYPTQRYFVESRARGITGARQQVAPGVRVYRDSSTDVAEVTVQVPGLGDLTAQLNPFDLRRLASDLLDAAADIEQHPADTQAAKFAPDHDLNELRARGVPTRDEVPA